MPFCVKHDLEFIDDSDVYRCPHHEKEVCENSIDHNKREIFYEAAKRVWESDLPYPTHSIYTSFRFTFQPFSTKIIEVGPR